MQRTSRQYPTDFPMYPGMEEDEISPAQMHPNTYAEWITDAVIEAIDALKTAADPFMIYQDIDVLDQLYTRITTLTRDLNAVPLH